MTLTFPFPPVLPAAATILGAVNHTMQAFNTTQPPTNGTLPGATPHPNSLQRDMMGFMVFGIAVGALIACLACCHNCKRAPSYNRF